MYNSQRLQCFIHLRDTCIPSKHNQIM